MRLYESLLEHNECMTSKSARRIRPRGIVVHSTGANNPRLSRYCDGPVDVVGTPSPYHWNQVLSGGRKACVHAFIGRDKDGRVATVQTLPWDWRGWHCGKGPKGSYNDSHVSFEICEDGLDDKDYFDAVYFEAVELCAHLCRLYDIDPRNVVCHSEAHKQGYASNHADVTHWFPRHGKTMDDFRAAVQSLLDGPFEEEIEMYNRIGELPQWAQGPVRRMVSRGLISGTGTGRKDEQGYPADLALSYEMMRTLVILDRVVSYCEDVAEEAKG